MQAGRGLPFEQQNNERKCSPRIYPFVERFIVFGDLPFPDASLTNQENESCCLSDLLGKLD